MDWPLRLEDLFGRVLELRLVNRRRARSRGAFYWIPDCPVTVRHRGDDGPQDAELIAREVEAAIQLLLQTD